MIIIILLVVFSAMCLHMVIKSKFIMDEEYLPDTTRLTLLFDYVTAYPTIDFDPPILEPDIKPNIT